MKRTVGALLLSMLLVSAPVSAQKPAQKPQTDPPPAAQDVETLKIDTNLVTVPVIASSRDGKYIADLKKEEFSLTEDGVTQEISFLATVNAPFDVALLLDTSDSTQEKLPLIQRAAITFLEQLGPHDKMKVVSFDGELHDLTDFTGDKAILRNAILKTVSGHDTRVYDAVQFALDCLRPSQRRKAIVIFTDGMDWHSDSATYQATIRDLDESGVIVYPIRFDTRADTERMARQQEAESNGVGLPTSGLPGLPRAGSGTPTTFPGSESPVPQMPRGSLPLPNPTVIFGRQTQMPGRNPSPNDPFPDPGSSRSDPRTDPRNGNDPKNDPRIRNDPRRDPTSTNKPQTAPRNDTLSGMLDNLYLLADSYLNDLADRSGGHLYRADTVATLPQAFAAIAAELRTQYLLGYYPKNKESNDAYRKIKVKTTRNDIAVRARPGYRPKGGQ
ncbi:MAG TPA: VWA domain-containing protein [Pyrinomonadaceae bacterium]|nr:VWA domain-containing protein [Pyrinomonadaceae bacterium]